MSAYLDGLKAGDKFQFRGYGRNSTRLATVTGGGRRWIHVVDQYGTARKFSRAEGRDAEGHFWIVDPVREELIARESAAWETLKQVGIGPIQRSSDRPVPLLEELAAVVRRHQSTEPAAAGLDAI